MNFWIVLAVALALAMDAFAVTVGLAIGLRRLKAGQTLRLAFHFGLFQFVMPVIGWMAGETVRRYIEGTDHWIAFALLLGVGGKMIYESFRPSRITKGESTDPTRGFSILLLSLATSLDALAVGLSFAALHAPIILPAVIIGVVAFFMTILGAKVGPLLGSLVGKRAELAGGLILILIGVKILADHL